MEVRKTRVKSKSGTRSEKNKRQESDLGEIEEAYALKP